MSHVTGFTVCRRAAAAGASVVGASLRAPVLVLALGLTGGCAGLLPKPTPLPNFHTLDARQKGPGPVANAGAVAGPTLVVTEPRAAAGLDSRRMLYVREAHRLEYFASNEWVDTPSHMLTPLIVAALEQTASFGAVVSAPGSVDASLRLDTEVLRLQQSFDTRPSQLRFTLRAHLVDSRTRKVLAWREFDQSVAAPSDDPRGGVAAANSAVQAVLGQLASFCAEASRALPLAVKAP
jgi:cholesterol transport system auxiliary component